MKQPTTEEILIIVNSHKANYSQVIKYQYSDLYKIVTEKYTGTTFGEKLYRYLHEPDINLGKCAKCGNNCKFDGIFHGFLKYCSSKCSNSSPEVRQLKKLTCLKKYGVDNPSKSVAVKEQKRETCKQHFGVNCNFSCEDTKAKIKQTNLEKYGAEYPLQSPHLKKQLLASFYERFFNDGRYKEISPLFSKDEYNGVEILHKFRCNKCNNIFESHLQDGRIPRCYVCYPIKSSIAQREIQDFLINTLGNTTDIIINDRKILLGKELDIVIPSLKIAIEFDGLYYHSELVGGILSNYHVDKTNACEKLGIHLIHIFEDEWMNKRNIVKSRLLSILGKSTDVIYARKCELREISSKECSLFLNNNHIQGSDKSFIRMGLYHKNDLLSVMTFGQLRKCMGSTSINGHYEMYRFCSKLNCSLVGAASRLLKYFILKYNPEKIISYADRRWSVGNVYERIGFKKVSISRPNYFYTMDHCKRHHRFSFRKSELLRKLKIFDPNLTEWQNMQLNGWDRIWDCGNLKYEWKSKNYPM